MTATNLPANMTYSLTEAEKMHDMEGGYLLVAGTNPVLYYVCDEASALDFGRTAEELAGLAPHYSEVKK